MPNKPRDMCWRPEWPASKRVRALFTTRWGGFSSPPFDAWNLGDHVGDADLAVAKNRRLLAQCMGVRPVFLQQVHGVDVHELHPDSPDGVVADASVSVTPGLACTVLVADCLPVLFAHERGVAGAHAGWRGLLGQGGMGVLERTWQTLQERLGGVPAHEVVVWLGPCIGPLAFEVGPEVREAFVQTHAQHAQAFVAGQHDRFLANLPQLARQRLQRLGFERITGNPGHPSWCTATSSETFFSHRRDTALRGGSGRMAACVWLTD